MVPGNGNKVCENSQKELRYKNKFGIIAVHGSENRRRGGL